MDARPGLETFTNDFRDVDIARAEAAVRDLLAALGVDVESDALVRTPGRVARMYGEFLTPEPFEPTTFENDGNYDEIVIVRDIPFSSLCEHHLLPFKGLAHIGYLPGERIVGLSKLARVVDFYARRLQVQERMTEEIADWLEEKLQPRGVGVVVDAEHLCVTLRGARAVGAQATTSAVRGRLREDLRTRSEFLALVRTRT